MKPELAVQQTVGYVLKGFKKATKFVSPNFTVKATHQGKLDRSDKQDTILVTVGRPNYTERQFIKAAKLAGEPFPIRKVYLAAYKN